MDHIYFEGREFSAVLSCHPEINVKKKTCSKNAPVFKLADTFILLRYKLINRTDSSLSHSFNFYYFIC